MFMTVQGGDSDGVLTRNVKARVQRKNEDNALTGNINFDLGSHSNLVIDANWVATRIDEEEFIDLFDDHFELENTRLESEQINQNRTELSAQFSRTLSARLELKLDFSGSHFQDDTAISESFTEHASELLELLHTIKTKQQSVSWGGTLSWAFHPNHLLEFGLGVKRETRDARQTLLELDEEGEELIDATLGNSNYKVQEVLVTGYFKDLWTLSPLASVEFGARLEESRLQQSGNDGKANKTRFELNPSAHFIYQISDYGQFRFSLATYIPVGLRIQA